MKNNLKYQFGIVHLNDDWIAPLIKTVEETTRDEARYRPAEGVASVWEIALHATGWMEDLLRDLTGAQDLVFADWPLIEDESEAAWQTAKRNLRSVAVLLQDELEQLDEAGLEAVVDTAGTTKGQRIASILVHNSYHAGQVVKIRQIFAAQARSMATV
jgi:uncharacterized damage-inducible protein DinB